MKTAVFPIFLCDPFPWHHFLFTFCLAPSSGCYSSPAIKLNPYKGFPSTATYLENIWKHMTSKKGSQISQILILPFDHTTFQCGEMGGFFWCPHQFLRGRMNPEVCFLKRLHPERTEVSTGKRSIYKHTGQALTDYSAMLGSCASLGNSQRWDIPVQNQENSKILPLKPLFLKRKSHFLR